LFRRTKPEADPAESGIVKLGGKGRPTPTRRESEAAARERARGAKDKKQAARMLRESRGKQNARTREGMRTGEERFLPKRDQGKVRRFIRDLVDSRLCVAEFLLPALIVIMVLGWLGHQGASNQLWGATVLLVLVDTVMLMLRLKRELKKRFPDESTKGTVFYALMRSLQVRFLRQPKTQVKLGQRLPEHY
jgi:Protein of unknown function (DUF3043)